MFRLLLFLAFLPGALLAQLPRNMYAWWDSPVARDLNLTDAQTRQIRQTVREYRRRLVDARANVEKAEIDLEDVFNEEQVDQKRGQEAVERLAAARAELTKALSEMSLRLRGVVTLEQWNELQRRRPRWPNPPQRGPLPRPATKPGPP
jgi:Spy/CpxP family protein refolding chaperone